MKIERLILMSCSAAFAVALAVPALAQSDSSLVQAAKQKASDKKAKRVFTNEDYPEKPETPAAPATGALVSDAKGDSAKASPDSVADPKPADAKPEGAKPADAKQDPKESKLAKLEDELALSKKEEQDLRQKLSALEDKAGKEQDEFRRNMYSDMVSNQQTTLSEYRRKQDELEKQIQDEKNKGKKSE